MGTFHAEVRLKVFGFDHVGNLFLQKIYRGYLIIAVAKQE